MDTAILKWGGGGHTKVSRHANYANCDMFAVLIQNGVIFFPEKAKNVLCYDHYCFFICTELYSVNQG